MSDDFKIRTFGKFILCGEHSVLRGAPAIALPATHQYFELSFKPKQPSIIKIKDNKELPHLQPFQRSFEHALNLLQKKFNDVNGAIEIDSNITLGSGLGGSATLCVAVGRLMKHLGWVSQSQLFEFCRELENVFHGKSSGLDVAVVLSEKPIYFQKSGDMHTIEMKFQPNWYLTHSGLSSKTLEDVKKVNDYLAMEPQKGAQADELMKECASLAESALKLDINAGTELLAKAINQANECFAIWDVSPVKMREQMNEIRTLGAIAVKPTGSGGGGYILSLWPPNIVPPKGRFDFIVA